MRIIKLFVLLVFVFNYSLVNGQNLLDTSTWTIGSGSVSGFSQNGSTSENNRDFGVDPFGNSSILWRGGNDSASNSDGGWNSSYHLIDNSETYRLVVWLKKTNSTDGNSYFGCQQWQSGSDTTMYDYSILSLNGNLKPNPYFWVGDLPQLNKWYMLVAYVHGENYNSNLSYGGIYDPVTGTKVVNITDYKFAPTTTKIRHRAYLYYDTNIFDRQYFFAPRMEMVDGNEPSIADLLGLNEVDPNLLAPVNWTVGTGSISGYSPYGSTEENQRIYHNNHIGDEEVVWQASPNSDGGASGGFTSPAISINHNSMYRLSVWVKKTGSNDGTTSFRPHTYSNGSDHTTFLNGTEVTWHPFWGGDLPKLNRWYLLVGYVHASSDGSTVNLGRIYDGVTGDAVLEIQDQKFENTATILKNQTILWASSTITDRQYAYAPRIELVNGSEWTIQQLLSINPESKLIFSYDVAGNQKQRFYCEEDDFCSPVAPTSRMIDLEGVKLEEEKGVVVEEQTGIPLPGEDIQEETSLTAIDYAIYPNPTKDKVTIQLSGKDYNLTGSISIYNVIGAVVKHIGINNPTNYMHIDVSELPAGAYFIHMHFTNGTIATEQIIKN
jgi:hypothetical protein